MHTTPHDTPSPSSSAPVTQSPSITLTEDALNALIRNMVAQELDRTIRTQSPSPVPQQPVEVDHRKDYPTFDHDPSMRPIPTATEWFPPQETIYHSPLVDQNPDKDDFSFFETLDPDKKDLRKTYAIFPKHAYQKYQPREAASDAHHSKITKEYDAHFANAQKRLAHFTRPLDQLLHHGLQIRDADDELMEAVIEFHRFARQELMYMAGDIHDSRLHFLRKEQNLPQKETVRSILPLKVIAEERKTAYTINKNMGYRTSNNNNKGNSFTRDHRRQGTDRRQTNNTYSHNKGNSYNSGNNNNNNNSNNFRNNWNNNHDGNHSQHSNQGKGHIRGQSRGRSQSRHQERE